MFSRPRLVVRSTREQEPLAGKFGEPRKRQVPEFGWLVGLVAGPVTASLRAGVLDRVVGEDRRGPAARQASLILESTAPMSKTFDALALVLPFSRLVYAGSKMIDLEVPLFDEGGHGG